MFASFRHYLHLIQTTAIKGFDVNCSFGTRSLPPCFERFLQAVLLNYQPVSLLALIRFSWQRSMDSISVAVWGYVPSQTTQCTPSQRDLSYRLPTRFLPFRHFASLRSRTTHLPFNQPVGSARWSRKDTQVQLRKQGVVVKSVLERKEAESSQSTRRTVASKPADKAGRSQVAHTSTSPPLKEQEKLNLVDGLKRVSGEVGRSVRKHLLNAIFDLLYKPSDEENPYFTGNFAPVSEIGSKVPVQVISGAVPQDFPAGTYIRTGPNPAFGGKFLVAPFGKTKMHWFEGDGMLHATYFEKQGGIFALSYKNKYVETDDFLVEKKRGRPTICPSFEGDPVALGMNALLNQWRYAIPSKTTCNTAVWSHGGRFFAGGENGLPYEIDVSDLSTIGVYDLKGEWNPTFTSHPKIDPDTKEMMIQGCNPTEPYYLLGSISADGNRLVHKVDVGLRRAVLSHDLAITPRFSVIFDFPLVIDVGRLMKGGNLVEFEGDSYARIGVIPRHGDSSSLRWYPVDVCYVFHIFNAFEDGKEIVLHGLRSRASFLHCDVNVDRKKWYARGITSEFREGDDPWTDGALLTRVHEWRLNTETGTVVERDLSERNPPVMEMPRINEAHTGRKYKYAYAVGLDQQQSQAAGMPKYGTLVKVDLSGVDNGKGVVKTRIHKLGTNRYATEPFFVGRPGGTEEDDGWILSYVHDETTSQSEVIIVDAQSFEQKPIARIGLPKRVPYGFHGTYVYAK